MNRENISFLFLTLARSLSNLTIFIPTKRQQKKVQFVTAEPDVALLPSPVSLTNNHCSTVFACVFSNGSCNFSLHADTQMALLTAHPANECM